MKFSELFEEAIPDDIHDVVEQFEKTIDVDVCNEVYTEHKGEYIHLFVGGYSEDGFSEEYGRAIAARLNAAIKGHGWFVAKCKFDRYDDAFGESDPEGGTPQIMCFIDIFPEYGEEIRKVEPTLYHLCRPEDAKAISEMGLLPRNGGNDHIQTENGRIYACVDYGILYDIAQDLQKHRGWTDFHYFEIDTTVLPNRWYEDVELPIISVWTPDAIPAHALTHKGKY